MIIAGKMPSHALGPKKGGAGDSLLLQKGHLGCRTQEQQQEQQQHVSSRRDAKPRCCAFDNSTAVNVQHG
jgi:hypothetical protein